MLSQIHLQVLESLRVLCVKNKLEFSGNIHRHIAAAAKQQRQKSFKVNETQP